MSTARSNTIAYLEVDGHEYQLGRDRDLVDLMHRIETIVRSEAAFVDLSHGDEMVSVLVSPGARVVVRVLWDSAPVASQAVAEDWSIYLPIRDWEM